jgi:hypothetical protein
MSTPGRKRVQPIPVEEDDDTDSTTEILVSSSSSNHDTHLITPLLKAPSSEHLSLLSNTTTSIQKTATTTTKKDIYVALNFDELSHIRNVQTNGEFATLLYDFQLYKTVVNGHICFTCRKVKFSLLKPGIRCGICRQRVCYKCQCQMTHRSDNLCFVSLNLLRRSAMFKSEETRTGSESSSSSIAGSIGKSTKFGKKKAATRFSCCIDCFVLFDPASLVK